MKFKKKQKKLLPKSWKYEQKFTLILDYVDRLSNNGSPDDQIQSGCVALG